MSEHLFFNQQEIVHACLFCVLYYVFPFHGRLVIWTQAVAVNY